MSRSLSLELEKERKFPAKLPLSDLETMQQHTDCDALRQTRSPAAKARDFLADVSAISSILNSMANVDYTLFSRSLRAIPHAFCKIPLRVHSWGS